MNKRRKKIIAIDIGTNSFHLILVESNQEGKFSIIGKEREVVRLGAGTTDMKYLTKEAMQRALQTLKRFKMIGEQHRAEIHAVATSAVREALNRDEFVRLVRESIGIEVDVISGFEEGRLIYNGAMHALPIFKKKALVVDIGGGSTEIILGTRGQAEYINSIKIGAIRMTQRFFPGASLRASSVKKCREYLRGAFFGVKHGLKHHPRDIVVGTSGTIQNICAMIIAARGDAVPVNLNSHSFSQNELQMIVSYLLTLKNADKRAKLPGLDPSRTDIIIAGALILEQIFSALRIPRMTYSSYALREGVLYDVLQKKIGTVKSHTHLMNIRLQSVLHLLESCNVDRTHANRVSSHALSMFDQLAALHDLHEDVREYLHYAALLHDCGYHISHAQHHRHSYYIIRNSELLGFTNREIEIIANVARYHRKSYPKMKHEEFMRLSEQDRLMVKKLAAILRIAEGLDRTLSGLVRTVECRITAKAISIRLFVKEQKDFTLEMWGAERRKQLLEQLTHRSISFHAISV